MMIGSVMEPITMTNLYKKGEAMKSLRFILLFLICFYSNSIEAVVVISIGGDCTIASVLREMGLRRAAYPFDWMFSIDFNSVLKSVEDDFQKFLDPDTLKVGKDKRVIENIYGINFVHDFPTIHHSAAVSDSETHEWAEIRSDWRNFIVPIREKYQRRIERFKAALSGSDHVFLIRYPTLAIDKDSLIKFCDLLTKHYPSLSFTILAVSSISSDIVDWRLEKIKNFHVVYNSPDFWAIWRNIFDSLGINSVSSRSHYAQDDEEDDWVCHGACQK